MMSFVVSHFIAFLMRDNYPVFDGHYHIKRGTAKMLADGHAIFRHNSNFHTSFFTKRMVDRKWSTSMFSLLSPMKVWERKITAILLPKLEL